jgi:hypothetical protein
MEKPIQTLGNDIYTRVILTIIAFALLLIALNPWIAPQPVEAQISITGRDSTPVAVHYISPQAVRDLVQALENLGGLPVRR